MNEPHSTKRDPAMTSTMTRTTKQATITRQITISEERAPWGRTIYAQAFEQHHGNGQRKNVPDVSPLERIPSDFGLAVRVDKQLCEGESYDVLLNAPGGGHTCDCAWGSYGGHKKPCRHVEAALQAVREQKL